MSTTSRVVPFRAALITACLAARAAHDLDGLQVTRRWPGPETVDEGIFLGQARWESDVASMKTGRQLRNEVAQVDFIVQAWLAGEEPDAAADVEARLAVLYGLLEDVLADDPKIAGVGSWNNRIAVEEDLAPFGTGWRGRINGTITITARLT